MFDTFNTMMNHKTKTHKAKTKCKNSEQCLFKEKCWFSHENNDDTDTESIKTYYTT